MTLTRFCDRCWADNPSGAEVCRSCGASLRDDQARDYVERLIRALDHPEPSTPILAATILGKIGDPRAIAPLSRLALHAPDPYIAAAAVQAVGRFKGEQITALLREVLERGAVPARHAAEVALRASAQTYDSKPLLCDHDLR